MHSTPTPNLCLCSLLPYLPLTLHLPIDQITDLYLFLILQIGLLPYPAGWGVDIDGFLNLAYFSPFKVYLSSYPSPPLSQIYIQYRPSHFAQRVEKKNTFMHMYVQIDALLVSFTP